MTDQLVFDYNLSSFIVNLLESRGEGMRKINSAVRREIFSTRINPDLVKELKHVAVDEGRPLNDLLEEAIALLLKGRAGKKQGKRRVL
jgi:hypothetical protein